MWTVVGSQWLSELVCTSSRVAMSVVMEGSLGGWEVNGRSHRDIESTCLVHHRVAEDRNVQNVVKECWTVFLRALYLSCSIVKHQVDNT